MIIIDTYCFLSQCSAWDFLKILNLFVYWNDIDLQTLLVNYSQSFALLQDRLSHMQQSKDEMW